MNAIRAYGKRNIRAGVDENARFARGGPDGLNSFARKRF
jgi:hypothetical protein